jgi:hypothetical protein
MKIRARVGMKASKTAEIQQSARLEEGDGMQGGHKGGGDERQLGLMRDCMMWRPLTAVFCHPRAAANDGGGGGSVEDRPRHCRPSLARPCGNTAAVMAARMMVPWHHQPSLAHVTTVFPRSSEQ